MLEESIEPGLSPVKKAYRPTQINCSGMLYSFKNREQCPWRGTLERDAMILWDVDPTVERYLVEPLSVDYVMPSGRKSHYTADRLVYFSNGRPPLLVEIKPRRNLQKDRAIWDAKFAAATEECNSRKWTFEVLTEKELRGPRLDNAAFFRRFLAYPADEQLQTRLLSKLAKSTTAGALLDKVAADTEEKSFLLPQLWQLIAQHRISANWKRQITLDSRLRHPEVGG